MRRSSRKDGAFPGKKKKKKKKRHGWIRLPELRGERWRASPLVRKRAAFVCGAFFLSFFCAVLFFLSKRIKLCVLFGDHYSNKKHNQIVLTRVHPPPHPHPHILCRQCELSVADSVRTLRFSPLQPRVKEQESCSASPVSTSTDFTVGPVAFSCRQGAVRTLLTAFSGTCADGCV